MWHLLEPSRRDPGLNLPLPMSKGIIPTGIGLAWLVGLVSAFAPAWVATRRDIVTGFALDSVTPPRTRRRYAHDNFLLILSRSLA